MNDLKTQGLDSRQGTVNYHLVIMKQEAFVIISSLLMAYMVIYIVLLRFLYLLVNPYMVESVLSLSKVVFVLVATYLKRSTSYSNSQLDFCLFFEF